MLLGECVDRIHVGALAEDVDGHDRLGRGSDRGLDGLDADVVGARLDVDEDGDGAQVRDRLSGREEGERGRDDLVALADAEAGEDQEQRIGTVTARDAMLGADVLGNLRLERFDLGAADERRIAHGLEPDSVEFFLEVEILGLEVE